MKQTVKRILATILCSVMVVGIVPFGHICSLAVDYTYDPDAAIEFAKTHCAQDAKNHPNVVGDTGACDKGWLCAEFVANCLVAGGFPQKLSAVAGLSGFGGQIKKYGKTITSSTTGTSVRVKMSSFSEPISKGDPIVILYSTASGSGNGHVVIYSGETNSDGTVKVYAHNNRKQNEDLVAGYTDKKGKKHPAIQIFAVHLDGYINKNNYTYITFSHWCWGFKGKGTNTWNDSDGILLAETSKSFTAPSGVSITASDCIAASKLPNGVKQDLTFGSGSFSESWNVYDIPHSFNNVDESVWVQINYSLINYSITYDLAGGTLAKANPSSYNVVFGASFTNKPTKSGYTFAGWTIDGTNIVTGVNEAVLNDSVFADEEGLAGGKFYEAVKNRTTGNIIVHAKWIKNTCTFAHWCWGFKGKGTNTWNDSDGILLAETSKNFTASSGVSVTANDCIAASKLPNGVKQDLTLGSDSFSESWNVYDIPHTFSNAAGNVKVQINYSLIDYTITYDLDGGTLAQANPSSYNVVFGASFTNKPTKSGYTFAGWTIDGTNIVTGVNEAVLNDSVFADEEGLAGGKFYEAVKNRTTGNITVHAKWEANSYTISYNANGGTNAPASQTKKKGETIELTDKVPTKPGYKFLCWCTNSNANEDNYDSTYLLNLYFPTERYSEDRDLTLYAVWQRETYSVSYNANGATSGMAPPSQTKTYGVTLTLAKNTGSLAKTGYALDGWTTSASGTKVYALGDSYNANSDVTLYAHWMPYRIATIFRDPEQETLTTLAPSYTAVNNQTAGMLTWSCTSDGVFTINGSTSASQGITGIQFPTATTAGEVYKVTITKIGGSLTGGNVIAELSEDGEHRLVGMMQGGQSIYADRQLTSITTENSSNNYWAIYKTTHNVLPRYIWLWVYCPGNSDAVVATDYQIRITIQKVSNATSKVMTYDAPIGTLPTPTRTGYTLKGWFTAVSGGTQITASTNFANIGVAKYYAQWTAKTYAVQFNGNGATSGSMSDQSFAYDVAQNLTANAFQRKYTVTYNYNGATSGNSKTTDTATATFNGWATSASGEKVYNDKQSVKNLVTSGSKTLYANWTLGTVTLPTPTKTGYTFGGWYTDSALTTSAGAAGAKYTPSAATTLYAKWTEASLTKIAVKTNPTKTNYYVGDTLDATGLTLTATYSDGSTKTISSGFTCNPTTLNTAGQQTITITYSGKTTTFTVTVNTDAVKSIAVKTNPTKTIYYVGDTLNTTGLTLTATYNSGKTETVSSGFTCSPTALNTAGTQTITVSYSGKTTTFTVTVNTDAVKSVAVKTNPTKTSYYVGDTLNTSGLTLTATYNSGKTETVSSGFTCSPMVLNTAGTQTITVSYGGKTTTFTVTVNTDAVKSIAVKTNPTKASYYVGDTLNTAGLTLTATYNSGKTITVSSGFTCSPTALNTAGTQTITVSYSGKTTTFDVTVQNQEIPEDAPRMTLSKEKARAGERVDITLSIDNNPGIVASSVNLTYDNTKLRLVEVKDGGLLGANSFSPGNDLTVVPYTVVWVDGLASQNYTTNGVLATFTFEVLEDAPTGETTITLNYVKNSTFNVDLNEVEFALTNGSIEVTDRTPGDINKDGTVDLKDVVVLRRYLSGGWNVTIDESNSDVNGDHVIDLKDTVLIVRYLAGGWNVTLQ